MGKRRKSLVAARRTKAPDNGPANLRQVVRLVHSVCCLAGSSTLIEDIRSDGGADNLGALIKAGDTPGLFNWLVVTLSFQGISDRAAWGYIERHGSVRWKEVRRSLEQTPSCPKLASYWSFSGCGYSKTRSGCARPDHYARCPLPRHQLRNGRLNQTAYSLFLFVRDIAEWDLVGWIDTQLGRQTGVKPIAQMGSMREALIGPLRNVYGVADKVLGLAFSAILLAAPETRPLWREVGGNMIAIDTLVHKFLQRSGVLRTLAAEHPYGAYCYEPHGCAEIVEKVSHRIDARQFNPNFPRVFPRFVQYALWRYCAQEALNICNSNRITDRDRCGNGWCQLYRRCARQKVGRFK